MSPDELRASGRDVGALVAMLAASALSVGLAFSALAGSSPAPHRSAFEVCRDRPAPDRGDEWTGLNGEWGWLPVGVTCRWQFGDSVVVQGPGWDTTVAVTFPLGVAGLCVHAIRRRSRRED